MSHALTRTSPYGGKFIGRCIKCGVEGLGSGSPLEPCPMDAVMSDEQALLDTIKDSRPKPLPVESAPKDGTMLRLLVDYSGEDGAGALEDAEQAWTIGFNNLRDTDEDEWQFAGWNWSQDCFVEGHGTVIGWLPFHTEAAP